MIEDVLQLNGLSTDVLRQLSYQSKLGKSLKQNLHHFDKDELLTTSESSVFRIVDMSKGKANDDGYRGVHLYYEADNFHYPIEVQFNTYFDRQINNWLHSFLYKKNYPNKVGQRMREQYENGKVRSREEFEEMQKDVLLGC